MGLALDAGDPTGPVPLKHRRLTERIDEAVELSIFVIEILDFAAIAIVDGFQPSLLIFESCFTAFRPNEPFEPTIVGVFQSSRTIRARQFTELVIGRVAHLDMGTARTTDLLDP